MSWLEYHRESERLASDGEIALHRGDGERAREFYKGAAEAEEKALLEVRDNKSRTYGITAVSAVSLYFKAAEWQAARSLAHRCLGSERLPGFAYRQLEDLLDSIKARQAGINLDAAQILISMIGGEILHGGAPTDLVVAKIQSIKSFIYRTTEYMKGLTHRQRGVPEGEIRRSYMPWIFQTAPGSYQFLVSVQPTQQLGMLDGDLLGEQIIDKSFDILQACTESPDVRLQEVVNDADYRKTFLKIARDLAPAAKENRFKRLDIRSANFADPVILLPATRDKINDAIKEYNSPLPPGEEVEIRGILRALHLDNDWIEVTEKIEGTEDFVKWRIDGVNEEVDDRIGPLVNQPVLVRAVQTGSGMHFIDIEADG